MSENRKNNIETEGGDVAHVFACKPYGREFTAIRMVALNSFEKTCCGKYSAAK